MNCPILQNTNNQFMENIDLPEMPQITNVNYSPPEQSDPEIIMRSNRRLNYLASADNRSLTAYVADRPGVLGVGCKAKLRNFWGDVVPSNYHLVLRQYWKLLTYKSMGHGDTDSWEKTHSTGISIKDTQEITATLGAEGEGLSTSISETFSHSVEVSQTNSVTDNYKVDGPEKGHVKIWILWQLMKEIVALDENGEVFNPPGKNTIKGDVEWGVSGLGGSIFGGGSSAISGAYLNYLTVRQVFPSKVVRPVSRIFKKE